MPWDKFRWTGVTYEEARAGCYDGDERLKDMDIDGVDAEILFPPQRTIGHFLGDDDDDFVLAGVDAYNNFLFERVLRADPTRLVGMAQIPSHRRRRRGRLRCARRRRAASRACVISNWPSAATASPTRTTRSGPPRRTTGMPGVHPHQPLLTPPASAQRGAAKRGAKAGKRTLYGGERGQGQRQGGRRPGRRVRDGARHHRPADLHRCVRALPGLHDRDDRDGRRLDPALPRADRRPLLAQPVVGQHPDQAAAVVLLVPQHDAPRSSPTATASSNRHGVGVDNIMWSTDYPHHGNDWPYSRKIIDDTMGHIPADERAKIVAGNARRIFGLGQTG